MRFENCIVKGKNVNPEAYHSVKVERGDGNYPVSPSMLKAFTACPSRWRAGYQPPQSQSMTFGSLLDCALLTPDQLKERYVCQPETYTNEKKETKPWTFAANTCKAWRVEQEKAGKIIVTKDQLDDALDAGKRIIKDPILCDWHIACDKQVWIEGTWHDIATGLFIPVRCLIDYVPRIDTEFASCLGDLKSSTSGALRFFQRNVYTLGYHLQAAFDLMLYEAATGEGRDKWCFIGIENFSPWQPFRRMLDPEFITIGKQQVATALEYYCQCLVKQEWPGYDDNDDAVGGWSVVRPEPWMAYEAISNHMAASVNRELTVDQAIERAGL